jgi:hypothetical protein
MRILYHKWQFMPVLLAIVLILFGFFTAAAAEVTILSVDQLKGMLDNPAVVIIDVRASSDWKSSDVKIKGAIRRVPKKFESWAYDFPKDKALVLY